MKHICFIKFYIKLLIIYIILYFAFSTVHLKAQFFRIPLWTETFVKDTTEKFFTNNNRCYYTGVKNPSIDVYLPDRKKSTGIAIVICPGGGYSRIAYGHEGIDVANEFVKKGIAAIILKYRLPQFVDSNNIRHFAPLLDAFETIRIIRKNAEMWGINKDKIGIMGFSAGGHLASSVCVHFNDPIFYKIFYDSTIIKPNFQILLYPVITFSKEFTHQGSKNMLLGNNSNDKNLCWYFSSEENVQSTTPPTFIVHTSDDKGVPVENSIEFFKALKNKNVPVELHIYPSGGHGFGLAKNNKHLNLWFDNCLKWINNYFIN